jgi:hypothetical protein
VDDTGLAVACVGANTNFALETGLRKLQKITCYIDGKLASKSADFDWKFTDTGKVKITFNYEFGDYGCDSGVQFSVSRWIKIYKNVDPLESGYMMSHPNGFAVSYVWYDSDTTQYNYRSPWYRKQRGSSASDRETVSSVKISSLMATLKRMEAVPAVEKTTHTYVRRLTDAVSR